MSTRARRRVVAMTGLITAVGLPLTACAALPFDLPDRGSSSGSSTTAGPTTGAGRPMDEATLQAALPDAAQIGDDWRTESEGATSPTEVEDFTPRHCAQLIQLGTGWDEVTRTEQASADVDFSQLHATSTDFLSITLRSYGAVVPDELFDTAGGVVADCARFDLAEEDGTSTEYRTSPLAFPQLGERTLAYRFTLHADPSKSTRTVRLDVVMVKVGHTCVWATSASMDDVPDPAVLETAVRLTMTELEETP